MTFLFIEHDMEVVMGQSDKVIVMAEGRVIAQGAAGRGAPRPARDRRIPRRRRRDRLGATAMSENGAILTTRDVVAGYVPEVDILNGVTIDVGKGEIVTVVGPNGAGKSTLIKTIFGLLKPTRGIASGCAARRSPATSPTRSRGVA